MLILSKNLNKGNFISHFLTTALWSTSGTTCENLDDKFDLDDLSEEFQTKCQAICDTFLDKAKQMDLFTEEELEDKDDTIEHDLWLTMHGHGAGFWDGDYKHGDELTKLAKSFPNLEDELRYELGE